MGRRRQRGSHTVLATKSNQKVAQSASATSRASTIIPESSPSVAVADNFLKSCATMGTLDVTHKQYVISSDFLQSQSEPACDVGWDSLSPVTMTQISRIKRNRENADVQDIVKNFMDEGNSLPSCTPPLLGLWLDSPVGSDKETSDQRNLSRLARKKSKRGRPSGIKAAIGSKELWIRLQTVIETEKGDVCQTTESPQTREEPDETSDCHKVCDKPVTKFDLIEQAVPEDTSAELFDVSDDHKENNVGMPKELITDCKHKELILSTSDLVKLQNPRTPRSEKRKASKFLSPICHATSQQKAFPKPISTSLQHTSKITIKNQDEGFDDLWVDEDDDSFVLKATQDLFDASPLTLKRKGYTSTPDVVRNKVGRFTFSLNPPTGIKKFKNTIKSDANSVNSGNVRSPCMSTQNDSEPIAARPKTLTLSGVMGGGNTCTVISGITPLNKKTTQTAAVISNTIVNNSGFQKPKATSFQSYYSKNNALNRLNKFSNKITLPSEIIHVPSSDTLSTGNVLYPAQKVPSLGLHANNKQGLIRSCQPKTLTSATVSRPPTELSAAISQNCNPQGANTSGATLDPNESVMKNVQHTENSLHGPVLLDSQMSTRSKVYQRLQPKVSFRAPDNGALGSKSRTVPSVSTSSSNLLAADACNLSITDDLLATLAEPDDILDSQVAPREGNNPRPSCSPDQVLGFGDMNVPVSLKPAGFKGDSGEHECLKAISSKTTGAQEMSKNQTETVSSKNQELEDTFPSDDPLSEMQLLALLEEAESHATQMTEVLPDSSQGKQVSMKQAIMVSAEDHCRVTVLQPLSDKMPIQLSTISCANPTTNVTFTSCRQDYGTTIVPTKPCRRGSNFLEDLPVMSNSQGSSEDKSSKTNSQGSSTSSGRDNFGSEKYTPHEIEQKKQEALRKRQKLKLCRSNNGIKPSGIK